VHDLVLILRYRKIVTYGFHALLDTLETHETAARYEVQFAESAQATIDAIRAASARTLVLWSFYSPDAAALSDEVQAIKAAVAGAMHLAGGVHATGEPVQTLDAGWGAAVQNACRRTRSAPSCCAGTGSMRLENHPRLRVRLPVQAPTTWFPSQICGSCKQSCRAYKLAFG
jgi:hypothetical protein